MSDLNGDRFGPDALALGSWNTWSRLSFEDGSAVIKSAVESGVSHFDVGYYWDYPHTEILVGHILRTLGVPREQYRIAEKLWLWDYPQVSLTDQLDRALVRLGESYVDTILMPRPAHGELQLAEYLASIQELISTGQARAWGMTNWDAETVSMALDVAEENGFDAPEILQLQYNVARRAVVESPEYDAVFARGVSLQPSFTLEGGILAGSLERDRIQPEELSQGRQFVHRNIARDAGEIRPRIRELYPELAKIAEGFGVSTARLSLAFALLHPHRSTVLVGVSSTEQLADNLAALDLARDSGAQILEALASFDAGETSHPKLFNPRLDHRQG